MPLKICHAEHLLGVVILQHSQCMHMGSIIPDRLARTALISESTCILQAMAAVGEISYLSSSMHHKLIYEITLLEIKVSL